MIKGAIRKAWYTKELEKPEGPLTLEWFFQDRGVGLVDATDWITKSDEELDDSSYCCSAYD